MGDVRLYQKARPFDFEKDDLNALLTDLFDTMKMYGGVGIAAPQMGESVRVFVLGVEEENPRYRGQSLIPHTVIINPEIHFSSEETEGLFEGCLSVPKLRGWVERATKITYSYFDEKKQRHEKTVEGFHARIIQHEYDHLEGILFPMRVKDFSRFGFEDSLTDYIKLR